MADLKITDLPALVAPAGEDLLEIVDDPGGTPTSKRVTLANLLAVAHAPTAHSHPQSEVTDLVADLAGKSATSHTHTGVYEPANANIQAHVVSAHAPSNAQKNSDITLAEIEAKLVGEIASHTHAGGGGAAWGDVTGTLADQTDLSTALALKAPLASPAFTGTVAGITKTMVGLGSVDNTTDAGKPVSTATQTALNLKAPLASPAFTGTVGIGTAPTASLLHVLAGTSGATASGAGNVIVMESDGNSGISLLAPDANYLSFIFGSPSSNTGAQLNYRHGLARLAITTGIAGHALVFGAGDGSAEHLRIHGTGVAEFASGPTAPTAAVGTNSTQLATTAYARAMPLDTLAAPTDVTTLNATTAVHGLLKKLDNVATNFMNGQGNWTAPAGGVAWGGITGTLSGQTDLQTALDGKSATGHTHTGVYEPANANIQAHVISAHAPANAQKNSDILKAEIEAVLTGAISSHSHAGGGGGISLGAAVASVMGLNLS